MSIKCILQGQEQSDKQGMVFSGTLPAVPITPIAADLVLQVLSFQADQERTYIKQRQAEGIAAAKVSGVQFGRPRKPFPENFEELYQRFRNNESVSRLAKECPGISESTLRLRLQERLNLDKCS